MSYFPINGNQRCNQEGRSTGSRFPLWHRPSLSHPPSCTTHAHTYTNTQPLSSRHAPLCIFVSGMFSPSDNPPHHSSVGASEAKQSSLLGIARASKNNPGLRILWDLNAKIRVRTGPSHWQLVLQATVPLKPPHCPLQAPAAPLAPAFTFPSEPASPKSFAFLSLTVFTEQSLNYTSKVEQTRQKRG